MKLRKLARRQTRVNSEKLNDNEKVARELRRSKRRRTHAVALSGNLIPTTELSILCIPILDALKHDRLSCFLLLHRRRVERGGFLRRVLEPELFHAPDTAVTMIKTPINNGLGLIRPTSTSLSDMIAIFFFSPIMWLFRC